MVPLVVSVVIAKIRAWLSTTNCQVIVPRMLLSSPSHGRRFPDGRSRR